MGTILELERERLRAMTAAQKLAVMESLRRQAWALTRAGVRARHPTWPAGEIEDAVREIFRGNPP